MQHNTSIEQNYHSRPISDDDEIDLRELLSTLWEGKLLILACTAAITVGGIAYALFAPQQWSSKASVIAPYPEQTEQLRRRLEEISIIAKVDLSSGLTEEKLFERFVIAFSAFDNKAQFLKEKGYLPPLDGDDPQEVQRAILKASKLISATKDKKENFYTLSFPADTAPASLQRMNEYLEFVRTQQVAQINKLLTDTINNKTQAIASQYQVQAADALQRLQEETTRADFALRVSKAASIETPVENLNNQSIFTIDIGAKALDEKLKVLHEIKDPVMINPGLADIRLQLESLKALPTTPVDVTPYLFLQSPEEPVSRDKPKRPLIAILSLMLGLMAGTMAVLVRSWWRKTSAPAPM